MDGAWGAPRGLGWRGDRSKEKAEAVGRRVRNVSVIAGLCGLLVICILAESEVIQRFSNAFVSGLVEAGRMVAADNVADQRVVVVQISEQDGDGLVAQWPLRFEVYERFLRSAWCLGAASAFIDISFSDHPSDPGAAEDLGRLVQTVDRLARAADGDIQAIEVLNQRCETPRSGPAKAMSVFFAPPSGALAREKLADFLVGIRVQSSGSRHTYQRYANPENLPTAAFALARNACKRGVVDGDPCHRLERRKGKYEIEVVDGVLTPVEQASFTRPRDADDSCIYAGLQSWSDSDVALDNIVALLDRLYEAVTSGPTTSWWGCPPVLTIPFYRLTPPFDDQTKAAIRGKIVILGSSVPGNNDLVSTRHFSEIPGDYLHALAVNALLASRAPAVASSIKLRVFVLFFGSLLVVLLHRRINAAKSSAGRKAAIRAGIVVMIAAVIAVCYLFTFSWSMIIAVSDALCFLFYNNVDWHKFDPDPVRFLAEALDGVRRIVWKEL